MLSRSGFSYVPHNQQTGESGSKLGVFQAEKGLTSQFGRKTFNNGRASGF